MESGAHPGRQQRRRRGCVRRRHRAVESRDRRRRLDPHPGGLYRGVRYQGDVWPGPRLSRLSAGPPLKCRTDDAACARRGVDAERVVPARSPRPLRVAAGGSRLAGRHRGWRARAQDRLQPGSRLCPSRSGDRRGGRGGGAAIRGARRDGRGGSRGLPVAARGAANALGGR